MQDARTSGHGPGAAPAATGPMGVGLSVSTGPAAGSAQVGHTASLSPAEFSARFSECWRVLWCAAAAVVHDRNLAQDIVQQAAVVGLENLTDFHPGTSFVAWMVRIVKNIALNEARRRVRHRTNPSDPADMDASPAAFKPTTTSAPASTIDDLGRIRPGQTEFDDAVMDALRQLDETARACLLMRVVLDMPYRNISLALDIPEGTAASHVHRARAMMRTHLRARGTPGKEDV